MGSLFLGIWESSFDIKKLQVYLKLKICLLPTLPTFDLGFIFKMENTSIRVSP